MAQTQNEHLTTEQISASFDKQLSPQEQAVFDAHISSCQQCSNKLSDLKLTTTLLHSLPVEEVPHSSVLPDNVSILPDRTMRQDTPVTVLPQRRHQHGSASTPFGQDRKRARRMLCASSSPACCHFYSMVQAILPRVLLPAAQWLPLIMAPLLLVLTNPTMPFLQRDQLQQLLLRRQLIRSLRTAKLRYLRVPIIQHIKGKSAPIPPIIDFSQPLVRLAQVS